MKSDEALGITTPENIKHLIKTAPIQEETKNKEIFEKIFHQAKEKVKIQIENLFIYCYLAPKKEAICFLPFHHL